MKIGAGMKTKILPKHKLAFATAGYWFLLIYIVVALSWWFVSLMNQHHEMMQYQRTELGADDPLFLAKMKEIDELERRGKAKYIGEFVTFLALISVGSVYVYRAVRKQFRVAAQQQNFMMAVTHELKTPIAIAKLNLETLQKHKLDEQKQQKILQMTLQETNRLHALTNNILISSQLEGGAYTLTLEDINLSDLAHKIETEYKQRYPDRSWDMQIESDLHIQGDAMLMQILINNLIDNALKYAPKQRPISLHIHQKAGYAMIQVKDEGPGIPDEEKTKIFQRFYRIGNELVRKTKGTGLGLYLCKKIAADHRATLTVSDNQPSGAIFTLHFNA